MKINLLVNWPGDSDRATRSKNAIRRIESMRKSSVCALFAFMGLPKDMNIQVCTAGNGRLLLQLSAQFVQSLNLVLCAHYFECFLK